MFILFSLLFGFCLSQISALQETPVYSRFRSINISDYHGSIFHPNPSKWESMVSQGIWLVEFYSPTCPHCQKFVPELNKLAEQVDNADWKRKHGNLSIMVFDCLFNQKFCGLESLNITFFPTIRIYYQLDKLESLDYPGDQLHPNKFEDISKYLIERLPEVSGKLQAYGSRKPSSESVSVEVSVNKAVQEFSYRTFEYVHGGITDISESNFQHLFDVFRRPWLISFPSSRQSATKFRFMRSLFQAVCEQLRGRIPCGLVDVYNHAELASFLGAQEDTYLVYNGNYTRRYQGIIREASILEFAESTAWAQVSLISTPADLHALRSRFEVVGVYVYTEHVNNSVGVKAFLEAIGHMVFPGSLAFGVTQGTPENGLRESVQVYQVGASTVLTHPIDTSMFQSDDDSDDVQRKEELRLQIQHFLSTHQFAVIPELTQNSILDVFKQPEDASDIPEFVVLLVMPEEIEAHVLAQLVQTSKQHGIRMAWVNGLRWNEYIGRVYGLPYSSSPRVILCVPGVPGSFVYRRTHESAPSIQVDPQSILAAFSELEDQIKQGNAEWGPWLIQDAPSDNPISRISGALNNHSSLSMFGRRVGSSSTSYVFGIAGVCIVLFYTVFKCITFIFARRQQTNYQKIE